MSKSPQSGDRIPVVQVSSPVARSNPKTRLSISRADLDWAKGEGLIRDDQVDRLWQALSARQAGNQRFDMAHLFWYAGAGLVILAMTVFMGLIATSAGALLATALVYMAGFAGSGYFLSNHRGLRTPGGLLSTLAVVTTPVAVLAAMQLTGNVSMSLGNQLFVEIATIVAGLVALQVVRFPFITAPIYAALWLMSLTLMDSSLINSGWGSNQPLYVTMVFGAAICALSFVIDRRTAEDYSFWGYFFGMLMVWGAWSFMDRGGELGNFIYFLGNVAFMVASAMLRRKVFLVFGSIGAIWYLGYLAYDIFADSVMFPVALLAIGVGVIYSGIMYRKHGHKLENAIHSLVKK